MALQKSVVLFLVLIVAVSAFGGSRSRELLHCQRRILHLEERTVYEGRLPLILPPGGTRYLVGSLVRTAAGMPVLAVGGYRIRHQHLHHALDLASEDHGWGQVNYQWLGELELVNEERFETVGRVRKVSPVAGFWKHEIGLLLGNFNDSDLLWEALKADYKELLHPKVKTLTYKQAVERGEEHLMKRLQRFLKRFRHAQNSGLISKTETYRHYILLQIGVLFGQIEKALLQEGMSGKERHAAIKEAFDGELVFESLYLYLSWLENDGVKHASIEGMRKLLRRFDKDNKLGLGDWREFDQMAHDFRDHFFGGHVDADHPHTLEEWMAFGGMAADISNLLPALSEDAARTMEVQILVLDPKQRPAPIDPLDAPDAKDP